MPPPRPFPQRCPLALGILLTALLAAPVRTQDSGDAEAKAAAVKAAVLFKLASYCALADAPPVPRPPGQTVYRLGIAGDDPTATAIRRQLQGKTVGGNPIQIVDYPLTALHGGEACAAEMLYVASSLGDADTARVLLLHSARPTLLVAERNGFAGQGGGVQLFINDRTVRFQINQAALKAQGLRASTQVLKLSREGPK